MLTPGKTWNLFLLVLQYGCFSVSSLFLPPLSPMISPNMGHSHFGTECRVRISEEENREAIWPTQPTKAWLSYFPFGLNQSLVQKAVATIQVRSRDQILFVKTSTFLTHWVCPFLLDQQADFWLTVV